MKETFVTTGFVDHVWKDGEFSHYLVGRKGYDNPIRLHSTCDAYSQEGNFVYIDPHGSAWVKQ